MLMPTVCQNGKNSFILPPSIPDDCQYDVDQEEGTCFYFFLVGRVRTGTGGHGPKTISRRK